MSDTDGKRNPVIRALSNASLHGAAAGAVPIVSATSKATIVLIGLILLARDRADGGDFAAGMRSRLAVGFQSSVRQV